MSPVLAVLITAVAVIVAVAVKLLVRRHTPAGGYFTDTQRGAGIFTVIGTAYAVILAFTFLVVFQSYDSAKRAARAEARAVSGLADFAEEFPGPLRAKFGAELSCYTRAVVRDEWPAMSRGEQSAAVLASIERLQDLIHGLPAASSRESIGLDHLLTTFSERGEARQNRIEEGEHVIPPLLWVVLVLGAMVVLGYMLVWSDSSERAWVQAASMAAVTTIIASSLLVILFLDNPYEGVDGSIKPVAMERVQQQLSKESPCPR